MQSFAWSSNLKRKAATDIGGAEQQQKFDLRPDGKLRDPAWDLVNGTDGNTPRSKAEAWLGADCLAWYYQRRERLQKADWVDSSLQKPLLRAFSEFLAPVTPDENYTGPLGQSWLGRRENYERRNTPSWATSGGPQRTAGEAKWDQMLALIVRLDECAIQLNNAAEQIHLAERAYLFQFWKSPNPVVEKPDEPPVDLLGVATGE